ncbi:Transmembrane protein 130 [Nymphon striatum]|nr:Transmembrane protein 130 [Nymphon striatum]
MQISLLSGYFFNFNSLFSYLIYSFLFLLLFFSTYIKYLQLNQFHSCSLKMAVVKPKPTATVDLTNDGPALLDASITFFAKLIFDEKHHKPPNKTYVYQFTDDSNPKKHKELKCKLTCNYTTSYNERKYSPGQRQMHVIVRELNKVSIAEKNSTFKITDKIPGSIIVTQPGNKHHPVERSLLLNKEVNFTAQIHDPEGYFENSTTYYSWHINSSLISYGSSFNYTFLSVGRQSLIVDIFALIWDYDSSGKSAIKRGSFSRELLVSDPIDVSIIGPNVLKHGQVIRLNVSCTGSAPFRYCWQIFSPNQSVPTNFTCHGPVMTNVCEFRASRYISKSGSYKFIVKISNDVSSKTLQQEISILDETKEGQLISIIVPVICSLFALAIIVWGIGYFVHTRNRYKIEVADFDFQTNASDLSYRTFFQRLQGSLFGAVKCCGSRNRTSSNDSSVSIYGSIQDQKESSSSVNSEKSDSVTNK